jgi:peptide-methionine (R)-S-oxide reductase
MEVRFGKDALPHNDFLSMHVNNTLSSASTDIIHVVRDTYDSLILKEKMQVDSILYSLFQLTSFYEFEAILNKYHKKQTTLRKKLQEKKKRKLQNLIEHGPTIQTHDHPHEAKRKTRRFKRRHAQTSMRDSTSRASEHCVVVNISSLPLSNDQIQVLQLGPKFCPVPHSLNRDKLNKDVEEGCRMVRLRELFFDSEATHRPKFYKPTGFCPKPGRDEALDAYCAALKKRTKDHRVSKRSRDNMTHTQRTALKELKQLVAERTLRISSADKGGAVVVQDTEAYVKEAHRQLNNELHYQKVKQNRTTQIAKSSNALVDKLKSNDCIDESTARWALMDISLVRTHQFYMLPKIHKSVIDPPGRPIVSGVNGPTENLSKLVDHWLQRYVMDLPSYIKDTTDMLQTLQRWNLEMGPFDSSARLVTLDVVGLYTNIPHADMEEAIRFFLDKKPLTEGPPIELLIEVTNFVLSNNLFEFDGNFYQQKFGTAMGTPMAPTVACLFMGWLEKQMLESSPVPVRTELLKRFIDDIFLLWTGTDEELNLFFEHINSVHSSIKFTQKQSTEEIPFLDINISLKNGFLQTDLFTKETDSHNYLHSTSCHPGHVCRNIPYSQFIRLRRLCSEDTSFQQRCEEMEKHFIRRGYKQADITRARKKAQASSRQEALTYKPKKKLTRTPFVVEHNPANPPLRTWFQELQGNIINQSDRMKRVMPEPPMLAERNCKSLRKLLMPSALPVTGKAAPGCKKCLLNRCVVCKDHLVEATTFRSDNTGELFTIRDSLDCESSNIIYMLYCDSCTQAQYIGETQNTLKDRFYKHRCHIRNKSGFCVNVVDHFNQSGHSVQNMKCIIIEKVYTQTREARIKRERFWQQKMQTMCPLGLNSRHPV